jgi:sugar O-acyltransferase (sialic acid O-acetyltransferase NeuD family)
MYKILEVPKVGNSDVFLKFLLLSNYGQFVSNQKVVCEFESSKTIFEFEVDEDGYFYNFSVNGESVRIGDPFAIISKSQLSEVEITEIKNKSKSNVNNYSSNENFSDDKIITNGAKKLIDQHNLRIDDFTENLINERIVNIAIQNKLTKSKFSDYSFKHSDTLIYGIGGHAGMCVDILHTNPDLDLIGYLDEHETVNNRYGLNYYGGLNHLEILINSGLKNIIIGTAFFENISKRQEVFKEISKKINIPTIIHPSAIIEKSATIANGCQIMAGAIIGSNVSIGNNCIINSGAIISHDSIIGHSTHVAPGACIAGGVKIGERVLVGMCSTVFLGLEIKNDAIIKNNESIVENL